MTDSVLAIDDIRIVPGDCLLIVGDPPAKTRLLRTIAGQLPRHGHCITVFDGQRPGSPATRSSVSFVHATSDLPRQYTVAEAIRWAHLLKAPLAHHAHCDVACARLIRIFGIDERHAHAVPARELDPQTRRIAALAMAFAGPVRLALLDDPARGLDDRHTDRAARSIHACRADLGVAVAIGEPLEQHHPPAELDETLAQRWQPTTAVHVGCHTAPGDRPPC